ncbi:hypothetical protein K458DRAFT_447159 [Lentithecium fluviatile CBS 122367]|uniref:Uncharacterized protein n=1 Tax=Lentithecium fluviatile CBS 122367 TaxID=1168545 RepID=A0A6G1IG00_9PLEO|nr:hypothetical protein K458DRAFT_447159 [Lentithecium fluviatile CBS 122367]
MPVGFGFSVGDFIATLNLVHDAIEAINDARGSSASYRALIRELYVLESALLRVKNLQLEDELEIEKRALEQTAAQCQRAIDEFFAKIQVYQPHLRGGGSGDGTRARMKDAWMKVKWAFCKEEDVDKFKADLRGHSTSIQLLLQTIEMKNASIRARKAENQRGTIAGQVQNASAALMSSVSSISSGIMRSLQQGKEQLAITTKIMQQNFQIFNMVRDIHKFFSGLPYQIQRDQPVYMIDAFGRWTPFHLEFIRSSDALLAVLRVNFEAAGVGTEKIDRRQIAFEDAATRREIDIAKNWESCFRPGQRVAMSVIFEDTSRGVTRLSTCPHCLTEQQGTSDSDIEWY